MGYPLSVEVVDQLFSKIDSSGETDGAISYEEFHNFAVKQSVGLARSGDLGLSPMEAEVQRLMALIVRPDASKAQLAVALSRSCCESALRLAGLNGGHARLSAAGTTDERWKLLQGSLRAVRHLNSDLSVGGSGAAGDGALSSFEALRRDVSVTLLGSRHGGQTRQSFIAALTVLASTAEAGRAAGVDYVGGLAGLLLAVGGVGTKSFLPLDFSRLGPGCEVLADLAAEALGLMHAALLSALDPEQGDILLVQDAVELLASPLTSETAGASAPWAPGGVQSTRAPVLCAVAAYLDYPTPAWGVSLRRGHELRLAALKVLDSAARALAQLSAASTASGGAQARPPAMVSILGHENLGALRNR